MVIKNGIVVNDTSNPRGDNVAQTSLRRLMYTGSKPVQMQMLRKVSVVILRPEKVHV
jgi:hypothetical protein